MPTRFRRLILTVVIGFAVIQEFAKGQHPVPAAYSKWKNGPPKDDTYFPIGVWLQNPEAAVRYKAAGINLYVGLWRGPTEKQLSTLRNAGMAIICAQNEFALKNIDDPIIIGWMHGDEPDNAQSLGRGKGYGPPILPEKIVRDYQKIAAVDSSRPVLLNLGQGVAWDNYIGRGVRRNHPEDYPEYVKGCDIASFDIYPVVHEKPEVSGKLEYVAKGVERLVQWAGGDKTVWNCVECTHISNPASRATPQQVRAEVWMALIHGSRGLIYFVHQFQPSFREAALLDDPEMLAAVTAINKEVHEFAPVLNSPTVPVAATLESSSPGVPLALMVKQYQGAIYLLAVGMRNEKTRGSFRIKNLLGTAQAEVIGESRTVTLQNGDFADDFKPYEVHLYRVKDYANLKR